MRLRKHRIAPATDAVLSEESRARLATIAAGRGRAPNVFTTLARSEHGFMPFLGWAGFVLSKKNSLPAREREIVILRIGFLCQSGYEFAQHERIGLGAGLTTDEIRRIKVGAADPGWSEPEQALLAASDEMQSDQFITEATWNRLGVHLSETQLMDLVFTASNYVLVSTILNTFGVQLDEGFTLDPDLDGRQP